jgi:hypothetical protein
MRARPSFVALGFLAAVLASGCRKNEAPASPQPAATAVPEGGVPLAEAPPAAAVPPEAPAPAAAPHAMLEERPLLAVFVGTGGDPTNGVVDGADAFATGSRLAAGVDVSVLPAGAMVKIAWTQADGRGLGEDHRSVEPGTRWLIFDAPGSYSWPEGTYRIEVSASTGGDASRSFEILPQAEGENVREPG